MNAIVNVKERAALPPELVQSLSLALADRLHLVYLALAVVAAIGFIQVVLFARARAAPREEAQAPERAMEPVG